MADVDSIEKEFKSLSTEVIKHATCAVDGNLIQRFFELQTAVLIVFDRHAAELKNQRESLAAAAQAELKNQRESLAAAAQAELKNQRESLAAAAQAELKNQRESLAAELKIERDRHAKMLDDERTLAERRFDKVIMMGQRRCPETGELLGSFPGAMLTKSQFVVRATGYNTLLVICVKYALYLASSLVWSLTCAAAAYSLADTALDRNRKGNVGHQPIRRPSNFTWQPRACVPHRLRNRGRV